MGYTTEDPNVIASLSFACARAAEARDENEHVYHFPDGPEWKPAYQYVAHTMEDNPGMPTFIQPWCYVGEGVWRHFIKLNTAAVKSMLRIEPLEQVKHLAEDCDQPANAAMTLPAFEVFTINGDEFLVAIIDFVDFDHTIQGLIRWRADFSSSCMRSAEGSHFRMRCKGPDLNGSMVPRRSRDLDDDTIVVCLEGITANYNNGLEIGSLPPLPIRSIV